MASRLAKPAKQAATGSGEGSSSDSSSASEQENEYVVDKIIAQSEPEEGEDEEEMYLVRWEGYPDDQCTWEPRESFLSDETLERWQREQAENHILSQDEVDEIQEKMGNYAKAEEQRRKQRRAGRHQDIEKTTVPKSAATSKGHKPLPASERPRVPAASRNTGQHHGNTAAPTLSLRPGALRSPYQGELAHRAFHGTGVVAKARRSSYRTKSSRPNATPGTHFRTLSTQNRHQKASKSERAPDLGKIKLRPATDFIAAAGEDVAHILPPGQTRPTIPQDPNQQIGNANQNFIHQTAAQRDSPIIAISNTTVPQAMYSAIPSRSQRRHPQQHVLMTANCEHPDFRWAKSERYWYKGEIIVHIRFGEHLVGDVRLAGLRTQEFFSLVSLKSNDRVSIDFPRQDMVTRDQYENLCRGVLQSHPILLNI